MNKHFGSNYIIFGWDAGKWFKQQVSRKKIHSPFQQAENSPKAHRFRGGGNEPAMTSALNDAHLSRSPCLSFWIFFFLIVIVSWFCAARQVFPEESFMHISYSPKQDIENFQNSQKQNISGYHSISKYLNFLQMIIWNFHMIWSFKNQSLKSQTNVQVFRIATNKMPSCIPI